MSIMLDDEQDANVPEPQALPPANPQKTNAYDEVPYKSYPYPQSHPARLATIATVLGLNPPAVETSRVLELGCCTGGNIVPMAEQLPEAKFLGIDASTRQVADGQADIQAVGLSNVELRHMDILDVGPELGEFDYIIAHGVYSWVPPQVQQKILKICKQNLSQNGVAYVSYNTFPGWRMRGIIRDIMLYRARNFTNPTERLDRARHLIDFLAGAVSKEDSAYGVLLQKELKLLKGKQDHYLLHDHLEVHNDPVYFHEFAARAQAVGLQYLGEADFNSMCTRNMPKQVQAVLQSVASDVIELEQYMDFVRNRMFRQTLLCHSNLRIDREIRPERLVKLYVASSIKPDEAIKDLTSNEPAVFRGKSAVTKTSDPLMKAALTVLGDIWPRSMQVAELIAVAHGRLHARPVIVDAHVLTEDSMRLVNPLIRCYETGQIELSVLPSGFSIESSPRPTATALARRQAKTSNLVTNLRHEATQLTDLQRHVIQFLDGGNDLASIEDKIVQLAIAGSITVHQEGKPVHDGNQMRSVLNEPLRISLQRLTERLLVRKSD
jgi:methyltransferase-like protein/2-polyprenyl-3-methyl-5-hydroxy-6-metoxy-1,4-benzoquinol methylase